MDPNASAPVRGLLLVVAVVALVFGFGVFGAIDYVTADKSATATLPTTQVAGDNRVDVRIWLASADPLSDVAEFDVQVTPRGSLATPGGALADDVTLVIEGATTTRIPIRRGESARSREVTVDLVDGDVGFYPFDRHQTSFVVRAQAGLHESATDSSTTPVDVQLLVESSHEQRMVATTRLSADSSPSRVTALITIERSGMIRIFVLFLNAVILLVGACLSIVTFGVAYQGRRFESRLMLWMAALLLWLPNVRHAMPGVPPIGIMTDYLIFFWVEVLAAICLLVMVLTWRRRNPTAVDAAALAVADAKAKEERKAQAAAEVREAKKAEAAAKKAAKLASAGPDSDEGEEPAAVETTREDRTGP